MSEPSQAVIAIIGCHIGESAVREGLPEAKANGTLKEWGVA